MRGYFDRMESTFTKAHRNLLYLKFPMRERCWSLVCVNGRHWTGLACSLPVSTAKPMAVSLVHLLLCVSLTLVTSHLSGEGRVIVAASPVLHSLPIAPIKGIQKKPKRCQLTVTQHRKRHWTVANNDKQGFLNGWSRGEQKDG